MKRQSGKQEHGKDIYGIKMWHAQVGVGHLALSKGEGEGEGFSGPSDYADFQPLTLVLSPYSRGEAKESRMEQH
jgi:hypothetical protein